MKQYHAEILVDLQKQYDRLQKRLEAAYEEKLDCADPTEVSFYDNMSAKWRAEQALVLEDIERHQNANTSYMQEGVRLLELAKGALTLYRKQNMQERRRLLRFVFSNPSWKNGELHPQYQKPFDLLAEFNTAYRNAKAASIPESGLSSIELPGANAYQNSKKPFFLKTTQIAINGPRVRHQKGSDIRYINSLRYRKVLVYAGFLCLNPSHFLTHVVNRRRIR